MTCKRCGNATPSDRGYCVYCRARLVKPSQPDSTNTVLIIALIIAFFALFLFGAAYVINNKEIKQNSVTSSQSQSGDYSSPGDYPKDFDDFLSWLFK